MRQHTKTEAASQEEVEAEPTERGASDDAALSVSRKRHIKGLFLKKC